MCGCQHPWNRESFVSEVVCCITTLRIEDSLPTHQPASSHLLHLLGFWIERRESPLRQLIQKAAIKVQVYLMQHPWGRKWQHASVFLLEESHGQRSQTGCSAWSGRESDITEPTLAGMAHGMGGSWTPRMMKFKPGKFQILCPSPTPTYTSLCTHSLFLFLSPELFLPHRKFPGHPQLYNFCFVFRQARRFDSLVPKPSSSQECMVHLFGDMICKHFNFFSLSQAMACFRDVFVFVFIIMGLFLLTFR